METTPLVFRGLQRCLRMETERASVRILAPRGINIIIGRHLPPGVPDPLDQLGEARGVAPALPAVPDDPVGAVVVLAVPAGVRRMIPKTSTAPDPPSAR